jgi:hypothetical protein
MVMDSFYVVGDELMVEPCRELTLIHPFTKVSRFYDSCLFVFSLRVLAIDNIPRKTGIGQAQNGKLLKTVRGKARCGVFELPPASDPVASDRDIRHATPHTVRMRADNPRRKRGSQELDECGLQAGFGHELMLPIKSLIALPEFKQDLQ